MSRLVALRCHHVSVGPRAVPSRALSLDIIILKLPLQRPVPVVPPMLLMLSHRHKFSPGCVMLTNLPNTPSHLSPGSTECRLRCFKPSRVPIGAVEALSSCGRPAGGLSCGLIERFPFPCLRSAHRASATTSCVHLHVYDVCIMIIILTLSIDSLRSFPSSKSTS